MSAPIFKTCTYQQGAGLCRIDCIALVDKLGDREYLSWIFRVYVDETRLDFISEKRVRVQLDMDSGATCLLSALSPDKQRAIVGAMDCSEGKWRFGVETQSRDGRSMSMIIVNYG